MARFLRSVLAQEEAVVASTIVTYDLPVNPLSFIRFSFRWQDGAAIGNTADPIADLLSFISRIEVLYKGQAIVSLNGADSYYMAEFLSSWKNSIINLVDAATERHYLSWILPFSRMPYWSKEAFPAVKRGELQLQLTYAAAVGTVDTVTIIIETVELLEANPDRFLKYTTLTFSPAAAGDNDVDLPIGNPLIGVGLFATTVPTGASTDRSIGQIRLLVDNVETDYANTNWESLFADSLARAPMHLNIDRHTHAMAAATDLVVGSPLLGVIGRNRYAYLDFDPLKDDAYLLDTAGRSRVHLRINSEGVTTAIRLFPVELMRGAR